MDALMNPAPPCAATAEIVATVIARRRSVRRYADTPIDRTVLERLVEAGIAAPSGSNSQNQRFLVIDDSDEILRIGRTRFVWPYRGTQREKIETDHPGGIVGMAKALIVVFAEAAENDRRGNGEYHLWERLEIQNCAAAMENILILATALGLANCWVSASEPMNHTRLLTNSTWRKVFAGYAIPESCKIQGIVLLGYPTSTDELGYPKGERKHGATVWQSTERKPLEHYLLRPLTVAPAPKKLGQIRRLQLRMLSQLLCWCLSLCKRFDMVIHRIENPPDSAT
jgi:nitroreductase